jgi:pimeloyl-ACP methyl ester carboxylesterase
MSNIIFIHGYESTGQGFKGQWLRNIFPNILTPNFEGDLDRRMEILVDLLHSQSDWILIGSSFGGLMATLFASRYPSQVKQLILLAPALVPPFFHEDLPAHSIKIPTTIYHGRQDDVVLLESLQSNLSLFQKLEMHVVDDDHRLHATTEAIGWTSLVSN